MSQRINSLVGKGLYTVQEATRLSGANSSAIKRWLLGYAYKARGKTYTRPPIFTVEIGDVDGQLTISFQDLVELLFVAAFRKKGVKWSVIHDAFNLARDRFESEHPFSAINFKTDGKRIFEETVERGRKRLSDLNRQQFVIADFIEPTLMRALEFDKGSVSTWYPNYPSKIIVLDPERSFGRPIVASTGVPTHVLFAAYKAEDDLKLVADEFDTPRNQVRAAIEFEARLAA